MIIYIYKLIFILLFAFIGYNFPPFAGISPFYGAVWGAAFALGMTLLTIRIKTTELKYIWSATLGVIGGGIAWIFHVSNIQGDYFSLSLVPNYLPDIFQHLLFVRFPRHRPFYWNS